MRYGLQRERLQRLRIGNTRVRRLVEGIANGDLRVLASKEQASWGKQDAEPWTVGSVLGVVLDAARDVTGGATRRGRSQRETMLATAAEAAGECVWCGDDDDGRLRAWLEESG